MRVAILIIVLGAMVGVAPAHAERWVPAYDPSLHVKPPMAHYPDGSVSQLVRDADWLDEVARYRRDHPRPFAAPGDVVLQGEVVVVQGDDESIETNGSSFSIRSIPAITRRVIEKVGDHFHALTLWTSFDDKGNRSEAYESTVKNEVRGLGVALRDMSASYGSKGTLRSVLNMKTIALRAGDTAATWLPHLSTWGQESGHRWMMFMRFIDPRTGRESDALLGRDCGHYQKYVDTQGSVHDGYAWRDNGDGTFSWTEKEVRYGNLDLYGMGLLAADEVPPFFLIDGIPGYRYPSCRDYGSVMRPPEKMTRGTRVDVGIDDVIVAMGERTPAAYDALSRQDYWREAQVVVTRPDETAGSPTPRALADRLARARLYWEDWVRAATNNRLVVCTQTTADCGDARSDVKAMVFNAARKGPAQGALAFDVEVANGGTRPATGVKVALELQRDGQPRTETRDLGALAAGTTRTQRFEFDLRDVPCGKEVAWKAMTTSDFHANRRLGSVLVGVEAAWSDDFESDTGWIPNPDGDDTATGAGWELGKPERSEILKKQVQPAGAHGGEGAWVTGLGPDASSRERASFVREGSATLESPAVDASKLRDPTLRYWVSFAGVGADADNTTLMPSDNSHLVVSVRSVAPGGAATSPWREIDRLSGQITRGWTSRTAVLPRDLDLKGGVKFRFVARDENPNRGAVEASVDDVELTSNLAACYERVVVGPPATAAAGDGCDCGLGGRARAGGAPVLALAALVLSRRRRRRR